MSSQIKRNIGDKLDPRVAVVALFVGVMEYEVFTISKGVISIAGHDAWLSFLIGGLMAAFFMYLMVKLASRFPKENLFQYNRKVWGKFIAFIIAVSYILYWLFYLTILISDTAYANKQFFLPKTPSIVPMTLLVAGAAWMALYGLTALIRSFQIMFVFILVPLLMIPLFAFTNMEYNNFLPVVKNGMLPVIKGALHFAGALQGLELILFLSPFLTNARKALKPALVGVLLIAAVNSVLVLVVIGVLGEINAGYSVYPLYDSITLIELPGFPVERFELFLTFPWIVGIFTTLCLFVYLASYGIVQVFGLQRKFVVFAVTVFVIAAAYIFPDFAVVEKARGLLPYLTIIFMYIMPVLTLLVAIIRLKRDNA
ncbi:MAG TPA: endospore germination permease [Desulfobacteria bacterium]|nr:endospore germination permease [Desulfobacteria bacterium]